MITAVQHVLGLSQPRVGVSGALVVLAGQSWCILSVAVPATAAVPVKHSEGIVFTSRVQPLYRELETIDKIIKKIFFPFLPIIFQLKSVSLIESCVNLMEFLTVFFLQNNSST